MKFTHRLKAHPLRLLLYLEWILFFLGIFGHIRAAIIPTSNIKLPPFFSEISPKFPLTSIVFILIFIILGLVQPQEKHWLNVIYIGLGFIIIGLAWIVTEGNAPLFLPLLLIMVIRGCLTFRLIGSSIVAIISITWFIASLYFKVQNSFGNLDVSQVPAIINSGIKPEIADLLYSNEEQLKVLATNMLFNITVLFCLITVFVFILVNALMSEYRSREELKLVNKQLREYALLIEDRAMLQERNRIAREIHDSLGHSLTALNLQLANALLYLRSNLDRTETFLVEAKKLGFNTLQDVRQSLSTLRSNPLKGKLLNIAILDLIEDLMHGNEIAVDYHNETTDILAQEVNIAAYRIVQEALTNIIKHSEATRVNVSLKVTAGNLQIKIQDNGVGFNPQENTTGFGTRGMKERATALGGQLELLSLPSRGCTVFASLPISKKQAFNV